MGEAWVNRDSQKNQMTGSHTLYTRQFLDLMSPCSCLSLYDRYWPAASTQTTARKVQPQTRVLFMLDALLATNLPILGQHPCTLDE